MSVGNLGGTPTWPDPTVMSPLDQSSEAVRRMNVSLMARPGATLSTSAPLASTSAPASAQLSGATELSMSQKLTGFGSFLATSAFAVVYAPVLVPAGLLLTASLALESLSTTPEQSGKSYKARFTQNFKDTMPIEVVFDKDDFKATKALFKTIGAALSSTGATAKAQAALERGEVVQSSAPDFVRSKMKAGDKAAEVALLHKAELEAHVLTGVPKIPVNTGRQVVSTPATYREHNNYGLTPVPGSIQTEVKGGKTYVLEYKFVDQNNKEQRVDLRGEESGAYLSSDGRIFTEERTEINNDYAYLPPSTHQGAYTIAFTDGCSWGKSAQAAAQTAAQTAQKYVDQAVLDGKIKTTQDAARIHLEAFNKAQEAIKDSSGETFGTTTIELITIVDGLAVVTSLGDPKVFVTRKQEDGTHTCVDVTQGERGLAGDATDCGGRLGSYVTVQSPDGTEIDGPDYRNLKVSIFKLQDGDMLHTVSDGVHDCLDPHTLGLSPSDCGLLETEWNLDLPAHRAATQKYMQDTFAKIVQGCKSEGDIPQAMNNYLEDVTRTQKIFMQQGGNMKNKSPSEYPGKIDHANSVHVKISLQSPRSTAPTTAASTPAASSPIASDAVRRASSNPSDPNRAASTSATSTSATFLAAQASKTTASPAVPGARTGGFTIGGGGAKKEVSENQKILKQTVETLQTKQPAYADQSESEILKILSDKYKNNDSFTREEAQCLSAANKAYPNNPDYKIEKREHPSIIIAKQAAALQEVVKNLPNDSLLRAPLQKEVEFLRQRAIALSDPNTTMPSKEELSNLQNRVQAAQWIVVQLKRDPQADLNTLAHSVATRATPFISKTTQYLQTHETALNEQISRVIGDRTVRSSEDAQEFTAELRSLAGELKSKRDKRVVGSGVETAFNQAIIALSFSAEIMNILSQTDLA